MPDHDPDPGTEMGRMRGKDTRGETIRRASRALTVAGLCLMLAACSLFEAEEPEYVERPVEDLYNDALNNLMSANYLDAAHQIAQGSLCGRGCLALAGDDRDGRGGAHRSLRATGPRRRGPGLNRYTQRS